jgi:hypothetical protein
MTPSSGTPSSATRTRTGSSVEEGGGALTRGGWGRRGAARGLVGASDGERQAAAQEARVGEERVGVGGGRPRRLRRQPPRGEGGGEGAGREGGTAPAASTAAAARRGRWGGGLGGRGRDLHLDSGDHVEGGARAKSRKDRGSLCKTATAKRGESSKRLQVLITPIFELTFRFTSYLK